MSGITSTFATTTALSILLHGAAVVGWLYVNEPFTKNEQSLELQLIGSSDGKIQTFDDDGLLVKKQSEQDRFEPDNEALKDTPVSDAKVEHVEKTVVNNQESSQHTVLESLDDIAVSTSTKQKASHQEVSLNKKIKQETLTETVQLKTPKQKRQLVSVSSIQKLQQQTMLELLHASISNNKEYPYIARRQRREGIAKVGFVLNPDGSIQNARLVTSSRASMLDRAALSAVRAIEPFKPAQQYLKQAEAFEIDVVFQLL